MFSNRPKFSIHVPSFSMRDRRFRPVGRAVVRLAELLDADIEISQRRNVTSIWVYYQNCGKKEIPMYCDWGKDWSEDDVCNLIRNKLYGLSFISEHAIACDKLIEGGEIGCWTTWKP